MRRSVVFVLFVAALVAAFAPFSVSAKPPDVPAVNGHPTICFTDALLQLIYPVSTGTPLPVQLWGGAALDVGTITMTVSPPYIKAGVATSANLDALGNLKILATGSVSVNNFPASTTVNGNVGVTSLPALPAGGNTIGTVGVSSLPALPAGSNAIGTVGLNAAIPTGGNTIGNVGVTTLPALSTGTNSLGNVGLNNWSVGAPTSFQGNLSATAPVNLASITSMLPNTFVMFQATAKAHIGAIGLASATMQFEEYVSAGERIGWRVGTSTFNLQFIADSAAAASYTIKVYPLY